MSLPESYHPESYWTEVAQRLKSKTGDILLAGDNSPYYLYKRNKFVKWFDHVKVKGKRVMELGCGTGENLKLLLDKNPKKIVGVDISEEMIKIAQQRLASSNIEWCKINGINLPFENESFDLIFCSTVLQHNSDEDMMNMILKEMCRCSKETVILFEETNHKRRGNILRVVRPVSEYINSCKEEDFNIIRTNYLHISISYLVCGLIRKMFHLKSRSEGEKMRPLAIKLESALLGITKFLDPLMPLKKGLTMMEFKRSTP